MKQRIFVPAILVVICGSPGVTTSTVKTALSPAEGIGNEVICVEATCAE